MFTRTVLFHQCSLSDSKGMRAINQKGRFRRIPQKKKLHFLLTNERLGAVSHPNIRGYDKRLTVRVDKEDSL